MTQWHDPVAEEVRRMREQQAAEVNYNLEVLLERARRRQKQSKRKTESFASAATSANRPQRNRPRSPDLWHIGRSCKLRTKGSSL